MNQQYNRILVTGGAGFLGSHVVRLVRKKYPNASILVPRSKDYDLRKAPDVARLFEEFKPEIVLHLATPSGGMGYYKQYPATVFEENALMGVYVLHEAAKNGSKKVIIAGSALGYPAQATQPYKESDFWNGAPEEQEQAYGLSHKILAILGKAHKAQSNLEVSYVILSNLYGPGDHFGVNAHVIPSIIKRFDEAVEQNKAFVENWGTGKALREFLYVEEAAEGFVKLMSVEALPSVINLGSGSETSMRQLSEKIGSLLGYTGEVRWDATKPEGRLRRTLDSSQARSLLEFTPKITVDEGLKATIEWYLKEKGSLTH